MCRIENFLFQYEFEINLRFPIERIQALYFPSSIKLIGNVSNIVVRISMIQNWAREYIDSILNVNHNEKKRRSIAANSNSCNIKRGRHPSRYSVEFGFSRIKKISIMLGNIYMHVTCNFNTNTCCKDSQKRSKS